MKILTGKQIREADRYTIEHEPVDSLALMERASEAIARWIEAHVGPEHPLVFFIGKGNNGGDGLAVARMLHRAGYGCSVRMVFGEDVLSEECRCNLERLPEGVERMPADASEPLADDAVVIDAMLGTGVRGDLSEPVLRAVRTINASGCRVISVDLPSGMLSEFGNAGRETVRASVTLTLEFPKLALLLPEGGEAAGRVVVLPIGLSEEYKRRVVSPYRYADEALVRSLVLPRVRYAHKGTYGHVLLVCGSKGMPGAAVLAAGGALRSGCGLVSVRIPESERFAVHAACPSAIVSPDPESVFSALPADTEPYRAVGVGCGVGRNPLSVRALGDLLRCGKPTVLDADALNMLASDPGLRRAVPAGSILTPHPGELRRLIGPWTDDSEKIGRVKRLAAEHASVVIVKGAHTMICTPQGDLWFNASGNPGMAKGGSGDVLTGYLSGLLARGYDPLSAALLGVYVHGRAGDRAAERYGEEGMNASDLVEFLGEAFAGIE